MWRCVNDIFSYCSKEPVWAVKPSEAVYERGSPDGIPTFLAGGQCQNSPNSCQYRRSLSDCIKLIPPKPEGSRKRKPKTKVPQAASPAPVAL